MRRCVLLCVMAFYCIGVLAQAPVITGYSTSKVCGGGNFTVTITATNNPTSYQWFYFFGGFGFTADDGILFEGSSTAQLTVLDATSWAGAGSDFGRLDLQVVARNASGSSSTFFIELFPGAAPNSTPVVTQQTSSLCAGSNNILYAVKNTGIPGLTWSYSGTGATITQPVDTAVLISFSSTASSGILTVEGQDSCGFGPAASIPVTVNSPSSAVPAGATGGPTVCASQNASVNTYSSPVDCSIIASIVPDGSSPVSGTLQSCVSVDGSVQTYHNMPYVQRHFNLAPVNNASTATGTVTLYFTQTDFTNYNTARGSSPALPSGPGDATGISNLQITAFNGSGTTPGTYATALGVIDPADNNIVWNSVSGRWEVTFSTTGFGGFFVSGDALNAPFPIITPLPDHLLVCNGKNGFLFGQTQNGDTYTWQVSQDQGNNWSNIGAGGGFITGASDLSVLGNDTLNNDLVRLIVSNTTGSDTSNNSRIVIDDGEPGMLNFVNPSTNVCQGQTQFYTITGAQTLDSLRFFASGAALTQAVIEDTFALVHYNSSPGTAHIFVEASNACGFGPTTDLAITINASSTDSANALDPTVCSTTPVYPGTTTMYTDLTCNGIGSIAPSGTNPVSGNIQTCVTVQNTVQTYNGIAYVPRYYNIEPGSNASTSTATITLYFTQADFDAYNTARGSSPALPSGPLDMTGISNLRIGQFHGTGTTPGTFAGSSGDIDPDDNLIVWNGTANRWEVTFNIIGFSGFFASGGSLLPLPLTLVNFTGKTTTGGNLLQWVTASEENTAYFEVERKEGGNNGPVMQNTGFLPLAKLPAAGNSHQLLHYSFTDESANGLQETLSYRLHMVDLDGKSTYSKIVVLQPATGNLFIRISPNPSQQPPTLTVSAPQSGPALLSVMEIGGRMLRQQPVSLQKGDNNLDTHSIADLPKGVYFISITTDVQKQTVKFIRE